MKTLLPYTLALIALATLLASCDPKEDPVGLEVPILTDIVTPTVWQAGKIYVVEYSTAVNANLTIEAGTVVKFKTGAELKIGWSQSATITANGAADKRIRFTSYSATPAPGAWRGVSFYSNTLQNSSISYCDFEYAGTTDDEAVGVYSKINFNNNTVRYAKSVGIGLNWEGSFVSMTGNTIQDCGTHAIETDPGAVHTIGTNNTITCGTGYGILIQSGDLEASHSTSATWKKQTVPYIFNGQVDILTNLTIEPGTTLKFNAYGYLRFGFHATTTITAVGTAISPIIFTSSNTTPAPGSWPGIAVFQNTNTNSRFEYCQISFAGKGTEDDRSALYVYMVHGLVVKNCSFSSSGGWGIYLDQSSLSATSTGNTFTNCFLGTVNPNP